MDMERITCRVGISPDIHGRSKLPAWGRRWRRRSIGCLDPPVKRRPLATANADASVASIDAQTSAPAFLTPT